MSHTQYKIEFTVTLSDTEDWPQEVLEAAEDSPAETYQEYVLAELQAAMEQAGQQYIDENPDLFVVKTL